ncbi:MAG: histidine kinase [Pedobacter sp.]|nr:MAG: histidine kinase [Pedobacter sp.]
MKNTTFNVFCFMVFFIASCAPKHKEPHKDNINYKIKDTVTSYAPNRMVRNVKQGKNGTILIAASFAGIFRYDGKSFTNLTSKIGSRRYWNVLEDRRGNLWIATTDSGVYKYKDKTFQHLTTWEGLASNSVFSILEDRSGNIWFGTGGGASRYDGNSFKNYTTKEGLSNNAIHTILEDKTGKLWFGTSGDACNYDGKSFTVFKNKDGKGFYNVWSIIEDKQGDIWFGASIIEHKRSDTLQLSGGLWRYKDNTFTKVSNRNATAIIEDKEGNIWTNGPVSPNGVGDWLLSRYDQNSLNHKIPTVSTITTMKKMLCGILEAYDGSIWFGSMNGAFRYDGKNITDFRKEQDQDKK